MSGALVLGFLTESTSARHLREIGYLVGGVGALALLVGGLLGYLSLRSSSGDPGNAGAAPGSRLKQERIAYMAAGLLIGVGFLLQIISARTS